MSEEKAVNGEPLVFILPANRRGKLLDRTDSRTAINRRGVYDRLEAAGFRIRLFDVNDWPRNPLARQASMLRAIDPLRALAVMTTVPRPRLVISHFESGVLLLALLRRIFFLGAPIILIDIGVGGESRLRERFLRFIIPRVAAIVTFGSVQVDFIRKRYRTRAIVEFIPQQVDTQFYAPDHGLAEEDYVLAVGDDLSRDYETLLKAVEGLPVRVVLKTNKVAEDKARYPNLSVIRKRLSDLEMKELYARARLVVLPVHDTTHAGGITALLEGMAIGKPVIVSNSAGLRDYIPSDAVCRIVPCGDAPALRGAITDLMADADARAGLGAAGRDYTIAHCSQDAMAARLVALMRRLLAGQAVAEI